MYLKMDFGDPKSKRLFLFSDGAFSRFCFWIARYQKGSLIIVITRSASRRSHRLFPTSQQRAGLRVAKKKQPDVRFIRQLGEADGGIWGVPGRTRPIRTLPVPVANQRRAAQGVQGAGTGRFCTFLAPLIGAVF